MFAGLCPVRTPEASSATVVSLTWCRDSMAHWARANCPRRCGEAWREVMSVIA